ncbi:hypothetical protein BU16DRAFT_19057 [Lophium mytilinum]|uniref:F-box domain-containing protein n=1 Tax=Lophium mytilinum TaxID=390894 RepID=A0A6A6REE5_9PEZI|nr:hypothetical protein BU16DRAFT_19057 [Lophium mytilinum]
MGQHWVLANIDKGERTGRNGILKLRAIVHSDVSVLPRLMSIPYLPFFEAGAENIQQDLKCAATTVEQSCLVSLAREVLDNIVEFLDPMDVVCLAMACKHLFLTYKDNVKAILEKNLSPWAGGRLICLGDYAESRPDGILTTEEEAELVHHNSTLYDCVGDYSDYITPIEFIMQRILRSGGDQDTLWACMIGKESDLWPTEGVIWILRNLDAKEYVRQDGFNKLCQNAPRSPFTPSFGPFVEPVGFGCAIVSKICWTDDPSGTYGITNGMHGEWAGNRLDVTTLERMEEGFESSWKDVSTAVMEQVKRLADECGLLP